MSRTPRDSRRSNAQPKGWTLRFAPDLQAAIETFAEQNALTRNEAVRVILRASIDHGLTHAQGYIEGYLAGRNRAIRDANNVMVAIFGTLPTSAEEARKLVATALQDDYGE